MAIDPSSLPPGVALARGGGDLPVVRVATAACTGEVYLQGAHVSAWTPDGAEPVLWMSERSQFAPGAPIRGGVPVCAPWFGAGKGGDKEPAHGWFRLATWDLAQAAEVDGAVTLRFTLDGADADVPAGEPADVTASYTVTFGSTLDLALTVVAGADGLELEEALHAYLAVSGVEGARVEGLDGSRYVDKAPGGRAVNAQSGDVLFTRETDRVYAHEGGVALVDPGKGRRITVEKSGSGSTVVWNPWTAKAAAMPDFGDDEWRSMACVEVANALASSVRLAAGESHTMAARYGVAPA